MLLIMVYSTCRFIHSLKENQNNSRNLTCSPLYWEQLKIITVSKKLSLPSTLSLSSLVEAYTLTLTIMMASRESRCAMAQIPTARTLKFPQA